jgi:hypothetical protein
MFWEQKIAFFKIKNIKFAAPWTLPPGAAAPLTPTNYALKTPPTAI